MTDVFAALLQHLRIDTSLFARIELGAPWGARIGQRSTVDLHHVLEGEMWLELGAAEIRVAKGDLVLLPHGDPHCLRHARGAPVRDKDEWMTQRAQGVLSIRRRLGGDGARTVVLCASLHLAGAGRSHVLGALPSVVRIEGGCREAVPGLGRLLDGIRDEVRDRRPGAPIMAARYGELLLLQTIRTELERPAPQGSWRAALADAHVARALQALYASPARAWTVASLARVAGQSRSGFARAFHDHVGETPLRHLTRWRMELAKEALRTHPSRGLAEVAASVGYRNEAAFSVAFRREEGAPPGAYRTARRGAR